MFTDLEARAFLARLIPDDITHIGFVAIDERGDLLITEPKGHPYGVSATFNKVKLNKGEEPIAGLERCIREQVGSLPIYLSVIDARQDTPQSRAAYLVAFFRGEAVDQTPDGQVRRWLDRSEALHAIGASKNIISRKRDLNLLAESENFCASPYRRVLLMVRELHRLGYQRLRAAPYMYPLAWRCPTRLVSPGSR